MKTAGKPFDPVTYEGAGHGFMKSGEDPAGSPENKKARKAPGSASKQSSPNSDRSRAERVVSSQPGEGE